MKYYQFLLLSGFLILFHSCSKKEDPGKTEPGILQLTKIAIGNQSLSANEQVDNIPVEGKITLRFSGAIDTTNLKNQIMIFEDNVEKSLEYSYSLSLMGRQILIDPGEDFAYSRSYLIKIQDSLEGLQGELFTGQQFGFKTEKKEILISSISINEQDFLSSESLINIDRENINILVHFSDPLDPSDYQNDFTLSGNIPLSFSLKDNNQTVEIQNTAILKGFEKYIFTISSNLGASMEYAFNGFSGTFYTSPDSSYKFPLISDSELLTKIQQQTFRYFYDFSHPSSGMARERNTSGNIITTGGSGMGIMALIVGVERAFISRAEALEQMEKILNFLETGERFHGVFPHWMNGFTGLVQPFSTYDDGADLVETSFLMQGLLTFRQYMNINIPEENSIVERINLLWDAVEWDWFARGQNVLYWHWSPNFEWKINMQLRGYNETLIAYILAIGSRTHPIPAIAYDMGYMREGAVLNGESYYGIKLPMGPAYGGPLFFTHYSFLGLDPRNLKDKYVSYWEQNVNHTLINHAYCEDNPKEYLGYSNESWGLTASDGYTGYSAHSPTNDRGIITPTAALSSLPYTPDLSLKAIHTFYYIFGDKLWGEYGFYDAFGPSYGWWADSYLAIDQGPIVIMIENYRTGLLWDLFMSAPEVKESLNDIGFTY